MSFVPCVFAATTALFVIVSQRKLSRGSEHSAPDTILPDRSQLPKTVKDWRTLFDINLEKHQIRAKWQLLSHFFTEKHGIDLWDNTYNVIQEPPQGPGSYPEANGFNFLAPDLRKSLSRWTFFTLNSGSQHAARTKTGIDVIIRVIRSGGQGDSHLKILRYLNSKKPDILLSSNHILPMISEITFHDITFAVFPKLDTDLRCAFETFVWDNSVEDILYMVLEALEGIRYLHENRIAHQDLFLQNFVLEWQPESLRKRESRRPRVYIIDFEDAILFEESIPPEERKVPKFPRVLEECGRPVPPEARLFTPYCPFRADMWQFGNTLVQFKTDIDAVTEIFASMTHELPEDRITAAGAFEQLDSFLRDHTSSTLHRKFPRF
ncbi:kinase-like domain-containing protein [Panaeolus papilionaceus]|nr:kinase-like domain-containing protein [Panaeolus papilionaceus]